MGSITGARLGNGAHDVSTLMVLSDGGSPGPGPFTASTLVTDYGLRVPAFVVSPWIPAGKYRC